MNITFAIAILEAVTIVGLGVYLFMMVKLVHSLCKIKDSLFRTALSLKVNVMKAEHLRKQTEWVQRKPMDVKRNKTGRGFIIIEPPLDFPNDRED